MELFGIKLVGVTAENGRKLLLTLIFIAVVYGASRIVRHISSLVSRRDHRKQRIDFWLSQAISLATAVLIIVGFLSIWFNDPTRLGTAFGFVTAGLAFALQKVVTAVAAYFVILRGKTFNVGDRIQMASVRGDVIALGFIQTTVMEMGEPPGEQGNPPDLWVRARQYTGRVVTITNDKIFDEPVYNYSRDFPFLWEEMSIPISYKDDRRHAEQIIVDAVSRHVTKISEMGEEVLRQLEEKYFMRRSEMGPRVYYRLTDNWVEMSVRFLARPHGIRELKDAISREILNGLDQAKIGIASGTYEIVGLPPIKVQMAGAESNRSQPDGRKSRDEVHSK